MMRIYVKMDMIKNYAWEYMKFRWEVQMKKLQNYYVKNKNPILIMKNPLQKGIFYDKVHML